MHRESFSPRHGRHDPEPADGNSPLRQILAAPGGDAGPLTCGRRRTRMPWRDSWLGEVRGGDPLPGTPLREPQACIVCSELAGDDGNLGRRSRRTAPATPRQPSGKSFTIIVAISGIPAVSVFAQRARLARERVRPAAAIRAGAGIQGRAAA